MINCYILFYSRFPLLFCHCHTSPARGNINGKAMFGFLCLRIKHLFTLLYIINTLIHTSPRKVGKSYKKPYRVQN